MVVFSKAVRELSRVVVGRRATTRNTAQRCRFFTTEAGAESAILPSTRRFVKEGFEKPVAYWLLATAGGVATLVCIGGYTRLTESGLSMTDWKFAGRPLPKSEEEWNKEMAKYQETPEYREVHYGLSMDDYRYIYFNEWLHRMVGRGLGLIFGGGLVYFLARRAMTLNMIARTTALLACGAGQGFVGWWMVKSGFGERTEEVKTPRVSPYRLTAHLFVATGLFCGCLWNALRLLKPVEKLHPTPLNLQAVVRMRKFALPTLVLLPIAFMSGAFVAGNDAGHAFNTWPKMLDDWVPTEVMESYGLVKSSIQSRWRRFCENTATVQFNHRMLAYATLVASGGLPFWAKAIGASPTLRAACHYVPSVCLVQVALGITAILYAVPVCVGVTHQAIGMGLLGSGVYLAYALQVPKVVVKAAKFVK